MFKFKDNSRVKVFLKNTGTSFIPESFCWTHLVWEMQNRILQENLLDVSNPAIVLCSQLLEWAIEKKAFLIYELDNILKKEVEPQVEALNPPIVINPIDIQYPNLRWFNTINLTGLFDAEFQKKDDEILAHIYYDSNRFTLDPYFASITNSNSLNTQKLRTHFSYNEAMNLTTRYIYQRQNHLLDKRNPDILIIKDDPLRFAFRVNSVHRTQLEKLVRSQLSPVTPFKTSPSCWDFPLGPGVVSKRANIFQNIKPTLATPSLSISTILPKENKSTPFYSLPSYASTVKPSKVPYRSTGYYASTSCPDYYTSISSNKIRPQMTYPKLHSSTNSYNILMKEHNDHPAESSINITAIRRTNSLEPNEELATRENTKMPELQRPNLNKGTPPAATNNLEVRLTNTPTDPKGICLICLEKPRDASLVHLTDMTNHVIACYQCSIDIYKSDKKCPICEKQIYNVIKL